MRTYHFKQLLHPLVGLLLAFPATFFIFTNILKHSFGWDYPYDVSDPTLITLGLKESLGWNINGLILFGPLIAFFLNVAGILSLQWQASDKEMELKVNIQKKWSNILTAAFSAMLLLILFAYLLMENL